MNIGDRMIGKIDELMASARKINIKKCPFCSQEYGVWLEPGIVVIHGYGDKYWVTCGRCKATTDHYDTEAQAINAWNVRNGKIENEWKAK